MRIAQVMLSRGFGGAERYFVDLTLALAGQGHQILAIVHPDAKSRPLLEHQPNITVAPLVIRGNHDWLKLIPLYRMLKAFEPDIIEAQLSRAALYLGRLRRRLGVPLTTHVHNYFDFAYFRKVDHFAAATRDQYDYLRQLGIPEERLCVVPNFSMLPARPLPEQDRPLPPNPHIVAMGRFVHKKGFDVLLRAFAALTLPGLQPHLTLAGDGPEADKLRGLVEELDISDRVDFPGWIEDVTTLLDPADLFVLPSRDEPFGIVVLEAMARNAAIVSTRTKGPVTILDEDTAWLCAIDDVEDLRRAMREALWPDPPQQDARRAKICAAHERYRTRYHIDAVLPAIIAGYEQALALGPR